MPKMNHGRSRELHPEFFTDEKLLQCSLDANRLFAGLWILADREGCLEEVHPLTLKARFFAAWNVDCAPLLEELVRVGVVVRYVGEELDGRPDRQRLNLIWLPGFRKRQRRLHPREMNTLYTPCHADPTPFANWVEHKDKNGRVKNPKPKVLPRINLGSAWVLPRTVKGARDLAGPAGSCGTDRDLSDLLPPAPPLSEGGENKKARGPKRVGRPDPNGGIIERDQPPTWSTATPHGDRWAKHLELLGANGGGVLEMLEPIGIVEGRLQVRANDKVRAEYVRDEYGEVLADLEVDVLDPNALSSTGPPQLRIVAGGAA